MRVLGIDPGFKATGYGLIDYNPPTVKLVETGIIQTKASQRVQHRLNTVYTSLGKLIDQHTPDVLVLEKLYAHYKHPTTASIMGHLRGVICLLCAQKNIELVEQSVKRIRQAVTGNGNASKVQTRSVVAHVLKINSEKLTLDASDALALALGYTHISNRRI